MLVICSIVNTETLIEAALCLLQFTTDGEPSLSLKLGAIDFIQTFNTSVSQCCGMNHIGKHMSTITHPQTHSHTP